MSIVSNPERVGNFTSSEIVALTKSGTRPMTKAELEQYKKDDPKGKRTTIDTLFGKAAMTYIAERNTERKLGRSLGEDVAARPTSWGKLCESFAFKALGYDYSLSSQETTVHPTIPYWSGSIDGNKFIGKIKDAVTDLKCPATLGSFCKLVDPLYDGLEGMTAMTALREGYVDKNGFEHDKHPDAEKYFFQLVSGAIITDCKYAELIIFMPYKSQLQELRDWASNGDHEKPERFYWIANNVHDDELPYLLDGGYYRNINIIRFEVTQEMKDFLTNRVVEAGKFLINNTPIVPIATEVAPESKKTKRKATGEVLVKTVPPIASNEEKEKRKSKLKEGLTLRSKLGKKYDAD